MPVITFLCPCFPLNYFLNIYSIYKGIERIAYENFCGVIFSEYADYTIYPC